MRFRFCYENSFWKSDLKFLRIDSNSFHPEEGSKRWSFTSAMETPFLKVWPNIFVNRFEIDSEILQKFDTMFTKRVSKYWSFAPVMKTAFGRSDLKFLWIDSKSILKFWRNLLACLRKGVPKDEVSPLLWSSLFEDLK